MNNDNHLFEFIKKYSLKMPDPCKTITCATANSVKNRTEVKYRTKTFLTLKFIFFSVDSDLLGPF